MANREFVVLMLPFSMGLATIPAYFRAPSAKSYINAFVAPSSESFVLRQISIKCKLFFLGFSFGVLKKQTLHAPRSS